MPFDLYTVPVTRIDGTVLTMSDFRGRVLLVTNVASKCGLTPQYEGLEALQQRFHGSGFDVLGFPSNDFAGQEPGTDSEIRQFCTGSFGATFPMFSKIEVVGAYKHPLYAEMIAQQPTSTGPGKQSLIDSLVKFGAKVNAEPEVLWNFEKFLIAKDGRVVARFSPDTLPTDESVVSAIEAELAQ